MASTKLGMRLTGTIVPNQVAINIRNDSADLERGILRAFLTRFLKKLALGKMKA